MNSFSSLKRTNLNSYIKNNENKQSIEATNNLIRKQKILTTIIFKNNIMEQK